MMGSWRVGVTVKGSTKVGRCDCKGVDEGGYFCDDGIVPMLVVVLPR